MTESVPQDGISAYFDEELSPPEREAMADHLSQSADARAELADIRRVSEELRALPRESAPGTLHAEVMNRIAAGTANSVAEAPAAPGALGPWAKWLAAAAALVLGAVGISFFWNGPNSGDSHTMVADAPPAAESEALPEAGTAESSPREGVADEPVPILIAPETEGLAQQPPSANENTAGAPPPEALPMPRPLSVPGPPERARFAPAGGANLMMAEEARADAQVERVLESAARQGEGVVIVEVVAEDREKTLASLQQLLARNAIAPADPESRSDAAKDQKALGLYVQSSRAQASEVLSQLRRQDPVLQIRPRTTLAMSRSDIPDGRGNLARLQRSLGQSVKKYQQTQARQPAGPRSLAQNPAAPRVQRMRIESFRSESRPARSAPLAAQTLELQTADTPAQAEKAAPRSFQMLIPAPGEPAAESERTEAPTENAPADEPAATAKPADEPAVAKSAREPGDNRPLRLMFIFRERPAEQAPAQRTGRAGGTQEK